MLVILFSAPLVIKIMMINFDNNEDNPNGMLMMLGNSRQAYLPHHWIGFGFASDSVFVELNQYICKY